MARGQRCTKRDRKETEKYFSDVLLNFDIFQFLCPADYNSNNGVDNASSVPTIPMCVIPACPELIAGGLAGQSAAGRNGDVCVHKNKMFEETVHV